MGEVVDKENFFNDESLNVVANVNPNDYTMKRLTISEKEFLKTEYEKGGPVEEIASKLGVPVQTIYAQAHKMGSKRYSRKEGPVLSAPFSLDCVTSEELAYVAGFLDADGTLGLYNTNKSKRKVVQVAIANSRFEFMQWVVDTIGGRVYRVPKERSGATYRQNKDQFRWMLTKMGDKEAFLSLIVHFLIIKREKAEEILQFFSTTKLLSKNDMYKNGVDDSERT